METKPNNSENPENLKQENMLGVLVNAQNQEITNQNMLVMKPNITNITNSTNSTNITNTTSILDKPETKKEIIHYYLFDKKEATTEEIMEASGMAKNSFWNLKRTDEDIITIRKVDKIAYYGISKEKTNQIQFLLNQKEKALKFEAQKGIFEAEALNKEEHFLEEIKKAFQDKTILKPEGLDLQEFKELYPNLFSKFETEPEKTNELMKLALKDMFAE